MYHATRSIRIRMAPHTVRQRDLEQRRNPLAVIWHAGASGHRCAHTADPTGYPPLFH